MHVYLLNHDDRDVDTGDTFVRGIYATRELAEADFDGTTTLGDRHDESCCTVNPWHVLEAADRILARS